MEFLTVTEKQKKMRWLVKPYITSSDMGHQIRIAPYRGKFGHLAWGVTPDELSSKIGVKFYSEYFGDEYYSEYLLTKEEAEKVLENVKKFFIEQYDVERGETDPTEGTPIDWPSL